MGCKFKKKKKGPLLRTIQVKEPTVNERLELRRYILESEELGKEALKKQLMDFFKKNTDPSDDEVHAYAEKIGMSPDEVEEAIYSIVGDIAGEGLAKEKNLDDKDIDPDELAKGIKIEMEHTDSKYLARRISKDHLAEDPKYYTHLIAMEKKHEE